MLLIVARGHQRSRRATQAQVAMTFLTAADNLWRMAWKPLEPSLVIQFICSERR